MLLAEIKQTKNFVFVGSAESKLFYVKLLFLYLLDLTCPLLILDFFTWLYLVYSWTAFFLFSLILNLIQKSLLKEILDTSMRVYLIVKLKLSVFQN